MTRFSSTRRSTGPFPEMENTASRHSGIYSSLACNSFVPCVGCQTTLQDIALSISYHDSPALCSTHCTSQFEGILWTMARVTGRYLCLLEQGVFLLPDFLQRHVCETCHQLHMAKNCQLTHSDSAYIGMAQGPPPLFSHLRSL